ncbi:PREDICTED: uncharacterized protein LOC105555885, partial [Vollenhovia emeryi]|uniref:uncharacterized protein LOC105555885 n=1 Tax=Vollenhovia emeryi TaxID=411798 RepID=UPI0005F37A47
VYNTTPHSTTGYTPHELIYGHRATLPTALTQPPRQTYSYDDYAQELRERMRATQQTAKEHLIVKKEKAKTQYDRRTKTVEFKVGEKVLLHDETVRRGRSKKLDSQWIGPYVITEKHSEVNYTKKRDDEAYECT